MGSKPHPAGSLNRLRLIYAVNGAIRLDWDELDWQDIATLNELFKEQNNGST
jgi:hypothetical protein